MPQTTAVFVHGFLSDPKCWQPFFTALEKDPELLANGFRFERFAYTTELIEWNVTKRIPTLEECGNRLGTFLDTQVPEGKLMLVGHSMGGLVIQSLLAERIGLSRGEELARIRSVILFATPNRGSDMLSNFRRIFSFFRENDQEQQLRVLSERAAELSDIVSRKILNAKAVCRDSCPIPFRVFWGDQDNVVPKASARGSFEEADALPGGHGEILQCNPKDPKDERTVALRNALLKPVGHPSVYEIDLFEVSLTVMPLARDAPILLSDLDVPLTVYADNAAIRSIRIVVSKQNRCFTRYTQTYMSENGRVQPLSYTEPNEILPQEESENRRGGTKFTYAFTPAKDRTFELDLKIYNGFGEGQRSWHNHMNESAYYKLFRLTLNLKAYHDAGYSIVPEPKLHFYDRNISDHKLCLGRELKSPPLPPLGSAADAWNRTWEVPAIQGGVVDLVWDIRRPA